MQFDDQDSADGINSGPVPSLILYMIARVGIDYIILDGSWPDASFQGHVFGPSCGCGCMAATVSRIRMKGRQFWLCRTGSRPLKQQQTDPERAGGGWRGGGPLHMDAGRKPDGLIFLQTRLFKIKHCAYAADFLHTKIKTQKHKISVKQARLQSSPKKKKLFSIRPVRKVYSFKTK